jgi:hypothetical protein
VSAVKLIEKSDPLHHELLRHLVTVADIAAAEQPGLAERYAMPKGNEANETFRTLARRLLCRARRRRRYWRSTGISAPSLVLAN